MSEHSFLPNSGNLSIRDIANSLIFDAERKNLDDFFVWPPDLFALTSSIFSMTGNYRNVTIKSNSPVIKWPPPEIECLNNCWKLNNAQKIEWRELVKEAGQTWRLEFDMANAENPLNEQNDAIQKYGVLQLSGHRGEDDKLIDRTLGNIKRANLKKIPVVDALRMFFNEAIIQQRAACIGGFEACLHTQDILAEKKQDWEIFKCLMTLHAICDEFSAGFCIRSSKTLNLEYYSNYNHDQSPNYKFSEKLAKSFLKHNRSISRISSERCNILPKRQSPHTGITLRSISGNLAYHRSSVSVNWHFYSEKSNGLFDKLKIKTVTPIGDSQRLPQKDNLSALSILLIPFPLDIYSKDFKSLSEDVTGTHHGYFHYQPEQMFKKNIEGDDLKTFRNYLEDFLLTCESESGGVDLVVLPETALSIPLLKVLVATCLKYEIPGFITGMRESIEAADDNAFKSNYIFTYFFNYSDEALNKIINRIIPDWDHYKPDYFEGDEFKELADKFIRQDKHHRWKLNSYQIKKYNLGGTLSITKNWWEGILVRDRQINFFNLGEEVSMCSLICEDLARQDPISDLLRSVGPNLVVTLLMDGEQLKHRWSARYASILSDDPGSAVITLTSLGMVKRFSYNEPRSVRSIGIVSDSKGHFTEINLKENEHAALIILNLAPEHENLADRYNDFCYTNHLQIGGIFPITYGGKDQSK